MTDDQKTPEPPGSDAQPGDEPVVGRVVSAEVDPHGATVVGAIGDEEGAYAVGVIDTDYANTVLAAEFAHPAAAQAAYNALLEAEVRGNLRIDGVLTVHTDAAGQIHVDDMTDHSTRDGVGWGALGGLVLGVIFPPSIIASTVAFGIVGGSIGKLRNMHHRDEVAKELEGAIGPDSSGILALVHAVDVEQVKEKLPEATKVTTTEIDEETAKDITETAKQATQEG